MRLAVRPRFALSWMIVTFRHFISLFCSYDQKTFDGQVYVNNLHDHAFGAKHSRG